MSTYREAWEAAKACQARTGKAVSLSVSLSQRDGSREWVTIFCHMIPECCAASNFAEAVAWFNARGMPAIAVDEVLTDVPSILERVT